MGIIDTTYYSFECSKCKAKEIAKVHDKGNGYSGSHWQHGPTCVNFIVKWDGSGLTEPSVTSAVCRACGIPAIIS